MKRRVIACSRQGPGCTKTFTTASKSNVRKNCYNCQPKRNHERLPTAKSSRQHMLTTGRNDVLNAELIPVPCNSSRITPKNKKGK